ncbi:MAG TPA: hypothetical protein VJT08_09130, partial [Terriglobales bacterium]|nr:hypothetical protein [Terriglobales bacterium]
AKPPGPEWQFICLGRVLSLFSPASEEAGTKGNQGMILRFLQRNRKTRRRLPTVAELFPEIITPLLDSVDDLPPCARLRA